MSLASQSTTLKIACEWTSIQFNFTTDFDVPGLVQRFPQSFHRSKALSAVMAARESI
jgi:hypothetical protein